MANRPAKGRLSGEHGPGWLVFFFSMPSKPVRNRVKLWRRLSRAGALQLKGAVYILPYTDANYEFCEWLVAELVQMNGDASFIRAARIETLSNNELVEMFNAQRAEDYSAVQKRLDALEAAINTYRKGTRTKTIKSLLNVLRRVEAEAGEVSGIDFFSSSAGAGAQKRIKALKLEIQGLAPSAPAAKQKTASIPAKDIRDYQNRVWVTRPRPFVDRIASAWLIRRFIDPHARFEFLGRDEMSGAPSGAVTFDIRDGEFTHLGELCTFEVLLRSFQLKDRRLRKIAETVHELDIRDERYRSPEARGIEDILTGISKTAGSDSETLEKGISVFEMLYISKG